VAGDFNREEGPLGVGKKERVLAGFEKGRGVLG